MGDHDNKILSDEEILQKKQHVMQVKGKKWQRRMTEKACANMRENTL